MKIQLNSGMTINNWTLISKVSDNEWICKCKCGTTRDIKEYSLKHNLPVVCIYCHYKNMDLSKFIRNGVFLDNEKIRLRERNRNKVDFWRKCVCGDEGWLALSVIKDFKSSLRCLNCATKARMTRDSHVMERYVDAVKISAKKRNLEYNVTYDYLLSLLEKQNYKCALSNRKIILAKYYGRDFQTASLDRIDSAFGYIENNLQWVHKDVNLMKSNYSEDYFLELCHNIHYNNKRLCDKPRTFFIDVDGCLVTHVGNLSDQLNQWEKVSVLPGVIRKLNEWSSRGDFIILTTGRAESLRPMTEKQLCSLGIFWNQLIMNIPSGPRVLINDIKPDYPDEPTAIAINLERNKGMEGLDI